MQFGYNPSEKQTYVSIEIKFSLIGRGFICLVPQNFMKSWAIEIGIESIKYCIKKTSFSWKTLIKFAIHLDKKKLVKKLIFALSAEIGSLLDVDSVQNAE